MLTGLAVFVPIVLLLGLWQGVAVFITLAFLQTFAESVVFPAVARVVITEAGAEKSAIGTGLIDAAGSSAAALSAFISPVVFDVADGPIGSFGMSGAVGATLLAIALTTLRRASEKQDVAPGCPDATSY